MSTGRMTNERWVALSAIAEGWCTSQQAEVRDELSRARDEITSLREQLRLANDKMAEQVRQARWEVADETLRRGIKTASARIFLEDVRDANVSKD